MSHDMLTSLFLMLLTLSIYQSASYLQQRWQLIVLNPMLITIVILIPFLIFQDIEFSKYNEATHILSLLLEPAIVALGFPLYQQLHSIKYQWKFILSLLSLGVVIVIIFSFTLTMILINMPSVAIALSLKSVTTPIGIALTEQLHGNSSITAFAIIIAGLFGALLGTSWLNLIHVRSPKAQGLAIGAASHVIGTAAISKISSDHGAYSSVALIFSALLTALISPLLIPLMISFFS